MNNFHFWLCLILLLIGPLSALASGQHERDPIRASSSVQTTSEEYASAPPSTNYETTTTTRSSEAETSISAAITTTEDTFGPLLSSNGIALQEFSTNQGDQKDPSTFVQHEQSTTHDNNKELQQERAVAPAYQEEDAKQQTIHKSSQQNVRHHHHHQHGNPAAPVDAPREAIPKSVPGGGIQRRKRGGLFTNPGKNKKRPASTATSADSSTATTTTFFGPDSEEFRSQYRKVMLFFNIVVVLIGLLFVCEWHKYAKRRWVDRQRRKKEGSTIKESPASGNADDSTKSNDSDEDPRPRPTRKKVVSDLRTEDDFLRMFGTTLEMKEKKTKDQAQDDDVNTKKRVKRKSEKSPESENQTKDDGVVPSSSSSSQIATETPSAIRKKRNPMGAPKTRRTRRSDAPINDANNTDTPLEDHHDEVSKPESSSKEKRHGEKNAGARPTQKRHQRREVIDGNGELVLDTIIENDDDDNDDEEQQSDDDNGLDIEFLIEEIFRKCRHGRTDGLQWLIQQADMGVDIRDDHGNTPLLVATQNGHKKTLKYLLKMGADPNVQNHKGYSALHYCALYGYDDLRKYLLEVAGADPTLVDTRGRTADDLHEEMLHRRKTKQQQLQKQDRKVASNLSSDAKTAPDEEPPQ